MCRSQTKSTPRGWTTVLCNFAKHAASMAAAALDVTLDLSMQIASQAVRAKVAMATKVSVVANYSCAVDG